MLLAEMRRELLAQHEGLRRLAREAKEAAERRARGDERARRELRAAVDFLGAALKAHNRREEELLGERIKTADAWGPDRAALMTDAHRSEHDDIVRSLEHAGRLEGDAEASRAVVDAIDDLLAHMAEEERTVLVAHVLSDVPTIPDSFIG
jgi:hypothetical protein